MFDSGILFGGAGFVLVFILLCWALFLGIVGFMIYAVIRRYRAAKQAGLDPYAGDIQLMGQAKNSAVLAPERTVAERLAEVDALHAAGTISDAEHQAARSRILGTV